MVCCVTMSHYRLSFSFLLTRTSLKLFSHLNCFSPFNYHRPSFDTILFGTKKLRFCYKKGEGEKSRAMIKTALPWIYWERNSKHVRLSGKCTFLCPTLPFKSSSHHYCRFPGHRHLPLVRRMFVQSMCDKDWYRAISYPHPCFLLSLTKLISGLLCLCVVA